MPVDEIARILLWRLFIQLGTKPLGKTDGAGIAWIDIAHQSGHFAFLKGPIAHPHCGLKRIPFAFGLRDQLPSKFRFGTPRTLIDLDLPEALTALSQHDRQISNTKKLPPSNPMAEVSPSPRKGERTAHESRAVRRHQLNVVRPIVDDRLS